MSKRIPLFPVKVALAVGMPVLLAILACFAAANMLTSTHDEAARAAAGFSRRAAAVQLERRTLMTAHHLRGYALTGERQFLEEAKKELSAALERLQRLKEAAGAEAGGFAEEVERVAWLVEAYKKAAEAVVAQNEAVAEARTALQAAGNRLVELGEAMTRAKKNALTELAVKYPMGELVRKAAQRIYHAQDLAEVGRAVLLAEAEAGRARRSELLGAVLGRFDGMDQWIGGLRPQASEAEAKAIDELAAAGEECRKAAQILVAQWDVLHAAGRTLALAERDALAAVAKAAENAATEEQVGLARLSSAHAVSGAMLWGFLGVILLFGLVWLVLAVRFLGLPVSRCAAFAESLVRGRVPGKLAVGGGDEVGRLAESLREMSRRFGRTFAR
jgi:CHASE3 domain sensor protein